jgi:Protein of unknown function (DUF3954)
MTNKVEIDLKEDAVLVIKNGQLKKINAPDSGFGEQTITWQNGKIAHEKVSYTVR